MQVFLVILLLNPSNSLKCDKTYSVYYSILAGLFSPGRRCPETL